MWGFHDRLLTLRKALHSLLTNSTYTDAFYRRWRWQTALQNKEVISKFLVYLLNKLINHFITFVKKRSL